MRKRTVATFLLLLTVGAVLLPGTASGQFLPWPFTTPVMDLLRREAAATYADDRRVEVAQKTMERIYDEMNGLGIPEYRWRDLTNVLADVEGLLESGASLGYRAGGLMERIDGLFRVQPGYDPIADQGRRWEAVLETYRTMAETGLYFADDLESASQTVGAIREQVEEIGHGFFGLTELGSHQESAQTESQAAITAAEEMMRMRENIALQINADIVGFMERIAQDRQNQILTRCLLAGDGCPASSSWEDDWATIPWTPSGPPVPVGDVPPVGDESPWCFENAGETCCLDPQTGELSCDGFEGEEEYGDCYRDESGYHCYDDEQICHTDDVTAWCERRVNCVAEGDDYCCTDQVTGAVECEDREECVTTGDEYCCYDKGTETTLCTALVVCEPRTTEDGEQYCCTNQDTGEEVCEPLEICTAAGGQYCCMDQSTELTTCQAATACEARNTEEGSDYCCTDLATGEETCTPLTGGECWMEDNETQCCYSEESGVSCEARYDCTTTETADGSDYCCTDLDTGETTCRPLMTCEAAGDRYCCTNAETGLKTCEPLVTCEATGDQYCCTNRQTEERECQPLVTCEAAGDRYCCTNADTGDTTCEPLEECRLVGDEYCCTNKATGETTCVENITCRPNGDEICCYNADLDIDTCAPADDGECITYGGETCCFDANTSEWTCTP